MTLNQETVDNHTTLNSRWNNKWLNVCDELIKVETVKKVKRRQNTQYGLSNILRWCANFFLFLDNIRRALERTHLCQTFHLNLRPVRVKGGKSLRNDMWHGLRNDIIMRNVIYEKCTLSWRQSVCKSCYFFNVAGSTTMTIKNPRS